MIRPGRLLAAAVIVALAVAAVVAVSTDRTDRREEAVPVRVATTPPARRTTTTTTITTIDDAVVVPAPTTLATEFGSAPLVVVEEGLAAWGRFAVDGNLDRVAPWFHPDGPQWARFEDEARELAEDPPGDPPYATVIEESRVEQNGEEAAVRAKVAFVRTGEPSQTFRWEFLLRESTGEWRIWTVVDQPLSSSTSIP